MNTNDELKEHAPGLYELRQKDGGMRVPEDYFKDFEARIFERIDQEGIRRQSAKSGLFVTVYSSRYTLAAAAAVALLIAALWFFKQPQKEETIIAANQVELLPEDATFYVLENTQEFEIEQLASIGEISNHTLPEQNPAPGIQNNSESPVNETSEEELNQILKDMSDEELESLING